MALWSTFLAFLSTGTAFIAGISLLGFVLYAVRPVVHSWMMDLTPDHLGGSATSLIFGTQSGFSIIMPIIGGMMADQYGLACVFTMLVGTILIANIPTLRLPKERSETSVQIEIAPNRGRGITDHLMCLIDHPGQVDESMADSGIELVFHGHASRFHPVVHP